MEETTTLQKRTNRFLRASEIGLVAFIFVLVASQIFTPADVPVALRIVAIAGIFLWAASLVVMFLYRNTDEYTHSLWSAGTSAAFIATTLLLVFGSFFEQLFYSFFIPDRLMDPSVDIATHITLPVLMLSFFAALQLKRLLTA